MDQVGGVVAVSGPRITAPPGAVQGAVVVVLHWAHEQRCGERVRQHLLMLAATAIGPNQRRQGLHCRLCHETKETIRSPSAATSEAISEVHDFFYNHAHTSSFTTNK